MDGHAAAKPVAAHAASDERTQPLIRPSLLAAVATLYLVLVASSYRDYAMDDAYIGFRYIANLLAGHGFVFEPGTRVEGVTNIAWLLLLATPSAVMAPAVAAKIFATALVGLAVWMLYGSARRVVPRLSPSSHGHAALPILAATLTVTSADFITFAMLGMETALLAALLIAMVWLSIDRLRPTAVAALGALAFLTHPEAALVVPLALAIAVLSRAVALRDALRCLAVFAVLVALATAARWAYFGAPLPNTFLAKPSTGLKVVVHAVLYATGASANISLPFTSPFALALAGLGYAVLRRAAPLAAAFAAASALTGFLFGLYAVPDWTKHGRYFAPYAPLALLLLCAGTLEVTRKLSARPIAPALTASALVVALGLPGAAQTFQTIADGPRAGYPGYVLTSATLIEPALWIRDRLPAEATIATRRVGALGYFGERRIFDYKFGLNDREVAQLIRRHNRQFDDPHDAALAELWRARAPDYLLEDGPVIDKAARDGTRESFRIHGLEYRVMKTFPIGGDVEWVLAERVSPPAAAP